MAHIQRYSIFVTSESYNSLNILFWKRQIYNYNTYVKKQTELSFKKYGKIFTTDIIHVIFFFYNCSNNLKKNKFCYNLLTVVKKKLKTIRSFDKYNLVGSETER